MQWLDRWRDHADARLDAMAAASLRRWLTSVAAVAAGVCVAAVLLHVLLSAALRSGAGLSWVAVAAVASIAVVLLVMVLRSTVVAVVLPQRRRTHLVAVIVSAAALLAGVQASAAATVALGSTPTLWRAEQLYAWHLADSLPLLDIPSRLEWSQPVVAIGAGDRAILVVFAVALIAPLAGILVALYHLTGGRVVPQAGVKRQQVPLFGRVPRSGVLIPLIAAAGFMWGGLGRGTPMGERILSGSPLARGGSLVAAALGVLLIAALLTGVIGALKVVWKPIADGPWMQLALAAALVWVDTPVRRLLLPNAGDIAAPWKLLVMLGLWAVLTILLLPVWVDPHLPETLLALGLLVAFTGPSASGNERLAAAIGWMPGGFAFGAAFATALACLAGAYLAYLVSRAPIRAANAGRLTAAGSMDLRRELFGYAYIGLQVVAAAAAVLLLLFGLGLVGANAQPMDASRSLLAVGWHVVDSVPGLDIAAIAGWRLGMDFTGRWAGAVVVVTVAMLVVVVVFPMIRATLRWARLRAGQSLEPPLAEVPETLLADLSVVREFLTLSTEDAAAAEVRLAAAEFHRGKLRDLLGEDSPVYWAADRAVSDSVDAYRTAVKTQQSRQWSLWPAQGTRVTDAVAAIDAYAAAVERWQMGADVVTEIETRLADLDAREDGVQQRELDATARERGVDARERMLELRESAVLTREQNLEVRAYAVDGRDQSTQLREQEVAERELVVLTREQEMGGREQVVREREEQTGEREQTVEMREETVGTREKQTALREREVEAREEWVEARDHNADAREQSVVTRERNAAARERDLEARERDLEARERDLEAREGAERPEGDQAVQP